MNLLPLFGPEILTDMPGFTERLAIDENIPAPAASGEEVENWVAIEGLQSIPASLTAIDTPSLGAQPAGSGTPTIAEWEATLDGLYPQISTAMRARWTVSGAPGTPFTRGEFGDEEGAAVITCRVVRRIPSPIATVLILREMIP